MGDSEKTGGEEEEEEEERTNERTNLGLRREREREREKEGQAQRIEREEEDEGTEPPEGSSFFTTLVRQLRLSLLLSFFLSLFASPFLFPRSAARTQGLADFKPRDSFRAPRGIASLNVPRGRSNV